MKQRLDLVRGQRSGQPSRAVALIEPSKSKEQTQLVVPTVAIGGAPQVLQRMRANGHASVGPPGDTQTIIEDLLKRLRTTSI